MDRVLKCALAVLVLAAGPVLYSGCQSTDLAVTVGYPVGTVFYMQEAGLSYTSTPLFWGVYLVTPLVLGGQAPSPLLVDTGFLYWPEGNLFVARFDLGLGLDLWIVHASIAVGASLLQWSTLYYGDVRTWGGDLTVRVGLKLGPVVVGAGLSAPLGAVGRFISHDWPIVRDQQDELMLFAGQLTASVGYRF